MLIQIYEVQDRDEAEALIEMGVDHIGSVLLSSDIFRKDALWETLRYVSDCGGTSSMIPLFLDVEQISRSLDHFRPGIVHFCESLEESEGAEGCIAAFERQSLIRERFPEIRIMRSVPIGPAGNSGHVPTFKIAKMFEPISDFFLTDTLVVSDSENTGNSQPVKGFVGITGKTCDWGMAAELVQESGIPVILAGGISPDNVREGLEQVKPAGVDSCTLTNAVDENGRPVRFRKDFKKVKRLVDSVRHVENHIGNQIENQIKN